MPGVAAVETLPLIPEALQYGAFGLLTLVLIGGYLLLRHEMVSRDAASKMIVEERGAEREARRVASERYNVVLADTRAEYLQALKEQFVASAEDSKQKRQDFLAALLAQQASFKEQLLSQQVSFRESLQAVQQSARETQEQSDRRWKAAIDAVGKNLDEAMLTFRGLRDEVLLLTASLKRVPETDRVGKVAGG